MTRALGAALALAALALTSAVLLALDRREALLALLTGAGGGVALLAALALERARRGERLPVAPAIATAVADDRVRVDSLANPSLIVDAAMRVTHANAAARLLLGERIVGEDVRVGLRHPGVVDAVAVARGGGAASERELTGLGRANTILRLRAAELGDGRVLLTFTDVTGARLAERMRVDFVANASHELKTPLATILGFIETLQGPAADDGPARARFLEIMAREAGRMNRLIEDLLSLSRIELDKYVAPRDAVELAPLLADVGRTLAGRLAADLRALDVRLADGLPRVVGDRDQILQVLHNLVSNALKYGRTGTPIVVRVEGETARRGEAAVRVSVTDEGEGIAAEHLPRLTERFYRADTGRSRAVGGTGLGLAIVKHIVERHRGRLEIASRPGEGTCVSFTLPVAEAGPDARAS